jgi:hypothetical protein
LHFQIFLFILNIGKFIFEIGNLGISILDSVKLIVHNLLLLTDLFLELLFALISLGDGLFVATDGLIEHKFLLFEFISDVLVVLEFCFIFQYVIRQEHFMVFEFLDVIFFLGDALLKLVFFEEHLLHSVVLTEGKS